MRTASMLLLAACTAAPPPVPPRAPPAPVATTLPAGESVAVPWRAETKLEPSSASSLDNFGAVVALTEDTAFVSAPRGFGDAAKSGVVYVYTRASGWAEKQRLMPQGRRHNAWFGSSMSVSGDTLFVGAQAAAYVFVRKAGAWQPHQKIKIGEGNLAVSVSGDNAVVGDSEAGTAFVFERNDGAWTKLQKLPIPRRNDYAAYGAAVAIDDDTAIVGAPARAGSADEGGAFIFHRSDGVWSLQQHLRTGMPGDRFGQALVISGDTALIGAPKHVAGVVYVYWRRDSAWSSVRRFTSAAASHSSMFGFAMALNGDRLVVGAIHEEGMSSSTGAAFIFDRVGRTWLEGKMLKATDGAAGDNFGLSVGVAGPRVVVGAPHADKPAEDAGAAYLFDHLEDAIIRDGRE